MQELLWLQDELDRRKLLTEGCRPSGKWIRSTVAARLSRERAPPGPETPQGCSVPWGREEIQRSDLRREWEGQIRDKRSPRERGRERQSAIDILRLCGFS